MAWAWIGKASSFGRWFFLILDLLKGFFVKGFIKEANFIIRDFNEKILNWGHKYTRWYCMASLIVQVSLLCSMIRFSERLSSFACPNSDIRLCFKPVFKLHWGILNMSSLFDEFFYERSFETSIKFLILVYCHQETFFSSQIWKSALKLLIFLAYTGG